jgi:hypothetical protein
LKENKRQNNRNDEEEEVISYWMALRNRKVIGN